MRTTTRREQRSTNRRLPTQRPQRQTGTSRTTSRIPQRGLSPKRPRGRSPLFGILSLVSFVLFWVFLLVAFNSLMVGMQGADGKRMVASAGLGLFAFLWPIIGVVLGIIGVVKQNSQKIVGGIGLGLNVILLLWIVLNMASKH
jgi:hypothetical protein